ncbi:hypothetical protein [Streptomyces sp. NPDC003877]
MTTPETTIDRIPIAQSVVYAVRGVPEVADEYNAERTIAPHEISLTYRASEDSQLGRVHAHVKGWWMEDGARVPMDKPVGRHFWGRTFADWPEWLAEEARLHDPAAMDDTTAADPLSAYVAELNERLLGCCQECNACAAIARDLAAEMRAETNEQPTV